MNKTRFRYHAFATGLSGKITRPFEETLDVQAPSALPPSGGYSSARRENIRVREVLTASAVHSEATGSYNEKGESYDTSARATVEGFNLSDVVSIATLTARVSSSHPAGRDVEPSITPSGTSIQGLRIAGRDIELESMVSLYSELNTMSALRARYKEDDGFRKMVQETAMIGRKDAMADERLHKFFPWCHHKPTDELPEFRGTAILPLFRILNRSEPGFTVIGNLIYVQNFGRIHIGELTVTPYERRVTALHVDLGSPMDAEVTGGSGATNGSTDHPPPE